MEACLLHYAIWLFINNTVVPEAIDIACQNVIKEEVSS